MVDYLLRDIPEQLHAKARLMAFKKKTTLRQLLLDSLERTLGAKQPTPAPTGEVAAPTDTVTSEPVTITGVNADSLATILSKKKGT